MGLRPNVLAGIRGGGGSGGAVAPGAVTGVTAGTATPSTQPLTWTAPTTGDLPITYTVGYRLTSAGGAYATAASGIAGTSYTVTGLTTGTAYDYSVTPSNATGSGTAGLLGNASTAASAVFSTYALGVAGTADGSYFSVLTTDTLRSKNYRRVGSVGIMQNVTPAASVSTAVNLARTAIQAAAMAVVPLLDFDPVMTHYGFREYPNLAPGSPAATLNMLSGITGSTGDLASNGAVTRTGAAASANGQTAGIRLQVAVGAGSNTNIIIPTFVPAGQWTLSLFARLTGGAGTPRNVDFSPTFGAPWSTALVDTAWQQLSVTFTQATDGTLNVCPFYQGERSGGGVTTVATDIEISDLALIPGAVALGQVSSASMLVRKPLTGDIVLSGMQLASNASNSMTAKFQAPTDLNSWTWMAALDTPTTAGFSGLFSGLLDTGASSLWIADYTRTDNGQVIKSLSTRSGNGSEMRFRTAGTGLAVYAIRMSGGGVSSFYQNGLLICTRTGVDLTYQDIYKLVFWDQPTINTGLTNGFTFWDSALSDAEIAAASTKLVTRLTAKGLTTAPQPNIMMADGDSITAGSGDATAGGFALRVASLTNTRTLQIENTAVAGATLGAPGSVLPSNTLYARMAGDKATIARFIAAGRRVIMPVLIGTNDSPATQAAVESYVTQYLAYLAEMRTTGAKVIASTFVPMNTGADAWDRTPIVIVGGAYNGQTFNGLRKYASQILRDTPSGYDGLADYAAMPEFDTYSATYFGDVAHPNPLGHSLMAACLLAVVNGLLA